MEGFLEFIIGNEKEAFVFKIVPMLNPDGVIVGNYRCSLTGLDLNRQWQNPNSKLSIEIYAMKEMIKKTLECR
jgi:murein tripeptide amidase MpaA